MASESGGKRKKRNIRFSSMKQPPLITQLKGILSEYPDNGQILKELIQNAEDAGAREVKILYDKRRINQDVNDTRTTTPIYTKFFKGPALCVYNDAVFTENDWNGIQMINMSVKKEDPTKVGRFGLGFKSVFHFTDYPCVISGDRVLLIDPHQPTEKVNATLELCALADYKEDGLDADAFWIAFETTFGLRRSKAEKDGFKGTLFWFPLRERPSDLSETLYNETKVTNLFDSFSLDASNILLFLKNIEKISLHSRKSDRAINETLKLEIEDKDGNIRSSRQVFKDEILSLECTDIHYSVHMTIHKLSPDIEERQEWLVVNYFVRDGASNGFKKLIQDKSLGYSPYVGIAAPLNAMEEGFEGHVFCFLPLPKEGERLTGLPVHVNGYFALSQNRHHMKWKTEEQEGKPIDDKAILWNKALIEEALPKAYELLVLEVIELAKKKKNDEISVKVVYNIMPLCKTSSRKTHKRWMALEGNLYKYLTERNIVYAPHTNEWINITEAVFATFRTMRVRENGVFIQESVVRCLEKIGIKYVDVPFSFFDTLQAHFPFVRDLTPAALTTKLKRRHEYKKLGGSDKLNVTTFLLHDDDNFYNIQDIELLPLASNNWTAFSKFGNPIYLCSDAIVKMFPDFENIFVMQSTRLGQQLTDDMERICKSGSYQLKRLNVDMAKNLLTKTLRFHIKSDLLLTKASGLSHHWLKDVWKVITDTKMIENFKDYPIVPILVKGTWTAPDVIKLVRLSDFLVVKELKEFETQCLNDGLIDCLKTLNVKVLPSLPEWITIKRIQKFVALPTKEGIASLFIEMYEKIGEDIVSLFNKACNLNSQMRETFLQFVYSLAHIEPVMVKLLRKLNLFRAVRSIGDDGQFKSVTDVNQFISNDISFPNGVDLPFICIMIDNHEHNLIKQLGTRNVSLETLVLNTSKCLLTSQRDDQVSLFMKFFIDKFHLFEYNTAICTTAAHLCFLRVGTKQCRPSDLFDPSDISLRRLLMGESLFPEQSNKFCDKEVRVLKRLGMKGKSMLTGDIMLKVAKTLDIWAKENLSSGGLLKKADEFLIVLTQNPDLLDQQCSIGTSLGDALRSLQCIPVVQTPPEDYPNGMPWYSEDIKLCMPKMAKHLEWSMLVGASTPIVNCSSNKVINWLKLKDPPSTCMILNQLTLICQHYNLKYKPDFMRASQIIYKHLHKVKEEISNIKYNDLGNDMLVWSGEGFELPEQVIIRKREGDLDLRPYFYFLPEELQDIDELFFIFNCHLEQDTSILLTTLQSIKQKYESHASSSMYSKRMDTSIVLEILKLFAEKKSKGDFNIDESELLMLVEDQSSENLRLQNVSVCIFNDDQDELDEEEEDNFYIVAKEVPYIVAKRLGVKSIKKKTILNATKEFSFKESGQHESLTTRISTLLRESYKDGFSVPKEVIQNADDAGATTVKFMYDERSNHDARRRDKLFTSELQECQGPALWIYNNSLFTDKDLKNITKLSGATKADNLDKIGKFGLGFNSVYNITDVPSFISGNDMIIFDPHETYLEEALLKSDSGLQTELQNSLIRRHIDQFKPYNKVFECDVLERSFTKFDGTLFRLPLRTDYQAAKSEICRKVYDKGEVFSLLGQFVENAGNVMLFTQNIRNVEIYHLPESEPDPSKAKLIFKIEKTSETKHREGTVVHSNILKRIHSILTTNEEFSEVQHVKITQTSYKNSLLISHSEKHYQKPCETKWLISWALGKNKYLNLSKRISERIAAPLSAVAIPITQRTKDPMMLNGISKGFYKEGHLYCFLPLPIITGLPVHINGCFSVTSDRRGLLSFTEDDKRKGDSYMWNEALMEDSVVLSYINLLKILSSQCSEKYIYHSLWPVEGSNVVNALKRGFYKKLLSDEEKLFRGAGKWLSFSEVIFLDPTLRCTEIGSTAFAFLTSVPSRLNKTVIELPQNVLKGLQDCDSSNPSVLNAMVSEEELCLHFLKTLHSLYWHDKLNKRNSMILFALNTKSAAVLLKLKGAKCIPSDQSNTLCKPNELINPSSDIAEMFDINEGYFPSKSGGFCEYSVVIQLINLGMNDRNLPIDMLLERCKSIEKLLEVCGVCARERSVNVLKYCGKNDVMKSLEKDSDSLEKIKRLLLIPVLRKPTEWKFTWKAENSVIHSSDKECEQHFSNIKTIVKFDLPENLCMESLYLCSGSVCNFVHSTLLYERNCFSQRLLKLIGVKYDVSIKLLICQLKVLSSQYSDSKQQMNNLEVIYRDVFDNLVRLIDKKSEKEISEVPEFANLADIPLIHIGNELVMPSKVAFNVKAECPPELYALRDTDYKRRNIFKALGVVDYFTVRYLLRILKMIYMRWDDIVCDDIELVSLVLVNLHKSMEIEQLCFEDLEEDKTNIVAPDSEGILRPTKELVIEDPAYKTSATLHILHGNISPDTGRALGVKSKQRRIVECFSSKFFTPFGQNESLVTRLTGILEDYPCDSSIMKELIQNADDAGATEINFIKNYESHSSARIFGKKDLQGPSLCIFNDSYFTEDDFNGIRNIGVGSKRDDPSKTGQYGIGFNAVYHLTDVPSFLTQGPCLGKGGQICIFDPLMTYLEDHVTKENPGIKCDVELMKESFSDMLLGYPDILQLSQSEHGTIFRLPLRQSRSLISKNVLSKAKINTLLEDFKKVMPECLLFLRNVKCIKISAFVKGKIKEEFKVEAKLTKNDTLTRAKFFSSVKQVVNLNRDNCFKNYSVPPIESSYSLKIVGKTEKNENWLIVNRFGVEHMDEKYESVWSAIQNKHIGLLPIASVALRLPQNNTEGTGEAARTGHRKTLKGKAFCFLPLPLQTGLPFHINGHFSLDKPRSKLWNEGVRKCWNEYILAELISRVSINALQILKTILFPFSSLKRNVCIESLKTYHDHFPLWNKVVDTFFKGFVSNFYRVVTETNAVIFPSCSNSIEQENCHDSEDTCLTWVSLSSSENDSNGTFNGVKKMVNMSSFKRTEGILVENALKKMGMKILETPERIYNSLEKAEIDYLPICCPKYGMKFIKSFTEFDSNSKCCMLGGIDIPLSETIISDVNTLISLLHFFSMDEQFSEQLDGLPLCLTNDETLRIFDIAAPVYCSYMCNVLTGSGKRFIHSKCIHVFDSEESGVIKRFEIDDLITIIAETFEPKQFSNGNQILWDKGSGVPLKQETIVQIFYFIHKKSFDDTSLLNQQMFEKNVNLFKNWTVLPSCSRFGSNTTFNLVPIIQSCTLLYKSSNPNEIDTILSKFNIPVLDKKTFLISTIGTHVLSPLQKMLPSTERPMELLECLLHHKMKVQNASLLLDESITLLSFFNNNINAFKQESLDKDIDNKLRSIPLFVTHFKDITSIDCYTDVIVLPESIPSNGLNIWAESTGICVLMKTDRLDKLYEFLNIPRMPSIDVYIDKILPNIHSLPREHWMVHIKFIRDNLLNVYLKKDMDKKQIVLRRQLFHLPFMSVAGRDKQINEFYNYYHQVFATMLPPENFLPEEYRLYPWSNLMELLGLIMKPTDELLIEFALELERHCFQISDKVMEQSNALVESLVNEKWSKSTFKRMSKIRFVVPYIAKKDRRNLFQQPGNGEQLICFAESTIFEHEDYCWSNTDLLPDVPYLQDIRKVLGILEFPNIDKIVKHCQNICDAIKTKLERKNVSKDLVLVQYLMEKLYRVLQKHFKPSMRKSFQVTPILFHPDDEIMLPVKAIVINLTDDEEIRPYLYKLPNCFGAYEKLFMNLGSHEHVISSHYADILNNIKEQFGDEPIPPNTLEKVKIAIENIVRLFEKETMPLKGVEKLYLPNRSVCLVDATTLTVSNNIDIEERLGGKLDLNFFIGFREIEILSISDTEELFHRCQKHLKPDILTDVVVEEISVEGIERKDSAIARRVESLFQVPDFLEGVLRLVKHQMKLCRKAFTKEMVNEFMLRLTNIRISKVSGLKTFLKYKDNKINGTERDATCFIHSHLIEHSNEEKVARNELFFQVDECEDILLNLIEDQDGLIKLIDLCTEGILEKEMSQHLSSILRMQDNPSHIKIKLDRLRIAAYDLPNSFAVSVFPRPGTYVEGQFHAFLEQNIKTFKEHEFKFVALEVDSDEESGELVFIYANIIRENRRRRGDGVIQISYFVDAGHQENEFITVPLHRLFKFTPRQREQTQALVVYDIEPIGCVPIDENFNRVRQILIEAWSTMTKTEVCRIVRRLLHRWHPDRNPTLREYADRVFNYVKQIVLKLENNEILDNIITDETGRTIPDMSGSSFGFESNNAFSRGKMYAAAFRDNIQEYSRSTRTGHFSHRDAERAVVRHIGEAKRWYRQAVFDFKAADGNLSSADKDESFNWVCYKCHQASEKALKAAWFAKNANRARQKGHSLEAFAQGLDDGSLLNEASSLQGVTGSYSHMRYPDAVGGSLIPAEIFGEQEALKAVKIAKRILDMAAEIID